MNDTPKHWLVRPENIRRLWLVFIVILAVTVVAELFIDVHPVFELEHVFAFNAIFGFLACIGMVLGAKVLGVLLKRPDTYYRDDPS